MLTLLGSELLHKRITRRYLRLASSEIVLCSIARVHGFSLVRITFFQILHKSLDTVIKPSTFAI